MTQSSNLLIGATLILKLPFRKIKFPETGISTLAILFFISGVVSSILNDGLFYLSIPEQANYFRYSLNRVLFLFLFVRYICDRKDFSAMFKSLVILGGITAAYTVADYFLHFTYDPNVKSGRAVGLFGDPNYVAANLAGLVPLTYYLFLHGKSKLFKRFYIINICSLVMAIFCTASRGGLLALVITGVCITIKNIKKYSTPFVLAFIILLFIYYGRDLFLQRGTGVQTFSKSLTGKVYVEGSAYSRIEHIQYGFLLWLKNPVFGVGPANSGSAISEQLLNRRSSANIHNSYASVLAEYGAVGFFLWMGLFIFAFRALARLSRHKDAYYKELALYLRLALLSHMITACFLGSSMELMLWISIALPVILDQIAKNEQQTESQQQTGLNPSTA